MSLTGMRIRLGVSLNGGGGRNGNGNGGGGGTDPLAGIPFILRLQTHRGDNVPLGINPTDGATNEVWEGLVSSVSQSVSTKRFTTAYESAIPVLSSDGVDDMMTDSSFEASTLNSSGFLVSTFRPVGAYDYATPIGGTFLGPVITTPENLTQWGIGKPGAFSTQEPITIPDADWRTVVVTWSGTSFRQLAVWPSASVQESGTLPNAFAADPGNVGLAVHGTDIQFRFFASRFVAAGAGTSFLSEDEMETVANYFQYLAPA